MPPPPAPPPQVAVVPGLEVVASTVGRRTVIRVAGELDMASAPALRRAVEGALDMSANELWIDFSELEFLDSSGVHVLLDARRRALGLQRRLVVVCPPGAVRRTFTATGTDGVLPLFSSRREAQRHA